MKRKYGVNKTAVTQSCLNQNKRKQGESKPRVRSERDYANNEHAIAARNNPQRPKRRSLRHKLQLSARSRTRQEIKAKRTQLRRLSARNVTHDNATKAHSWIGQNAKQTTSNTSDVNEHGQEESAKLKNTEKETTKLLQTISTTQTKNKIQA